VNKKGGKQSIAVKPPKWGVAIINN